MSSHFAFFFRMQEPLVHWYLIGEQLVSEISQRERSKGNRTLMQGWFHSKSIGEWLPCVQFISSTPSVQSISPLQTNKGCGGLLALQVIVGLAVKNGSFLHQLQLIIQIQVFCKPFINQYQTVPLSTNVPFLSLSPINNLQQKTSSLSSWQSSRPSHSWRFSTQIPVVHRNWPSWHAGGYKKYWVIT